MRNLNVLRITGLLLVVLVAGEAAAQGQLPDPETFFELKIRPTLAGTCFKCHGGKKVSNGLRVDSRDGLLKGGDSGPAIIPGDPQKSLLVQAIRYGDALKMPPKEKLKPEAIEALVTWVKIVSRSKNSLYFREKSAFEYATII